MKNILKLILAAVVMFAYSACHKVDDLPQYGNGSAVVLSSSVASVAAAPADSNSNVLVLAWTDPKYAQDPSLYKFVIEMDSSGRNFSKEYTWTVIGKLSDTIIAKDLNAILLNFGFAFNTAYDVDVRITSSYGNNNEQYMSNVLKIRMTPYKVPPKIDPPASGKLFIVGSATGGGWNNPVPVPSQELARIDETTFVGVFDMSGGNQYLLLPVNGDWSHKYSMQDPSQPAGAGDFGYDLPNNFNGPGGSGTYLVVVDFQHGKYSLTPYTGPRLPDNLFMVGDATPGGWNNPVPVPSQQFTRLNSVQFELTVAITGGNQFLFLPVNGDWSHKYAVTSTGLPGLSGGGYFGYDFPSNFPAPATSGTYKFAVNFAIHDPAAPTDATARFTVTQ